MSTVREKNANLNSHPPRYTESAEKIDSIMSVRTNAVNNVAVTHI